MWIIEIAALDNGAHRNQTFYGDTIPDGWAVIPEGMEIPNTFPFVDITVEEAEGVAVVTSVTAGVVPDPEPVPEAEPTSEELLKILAGVTE